MVLLISIETESFPYAMCPFGERAQPIFFQTGGFIQTGRHLLKSAGAGWLQGKAHLHGCSG
jgi:hypothetical protein